MTFSLNIKTAQDLQAEQAAALMASMIRRVDDLVETTAKGRGYNSAAHMASYVASTVAEWQDEATRFVAWRDQVWLYVIAARAAAESTGRFNSDVFLAGIPAIVWAEDENQTPE